jgi:alkanesulfonate monooxygenase SsuD/methylene tetrahydromethanopterin reductase-like flavin-dependent oxidoreductase (luciferase family)
MKVGIYLDARNPRAWQRPWTRHYGWLIEQVVEADRLGLQSVWLGEHHFFDDGYLPQPLALAAALAGRTRHLRLGTSVLLAPLRPAVDIAEQAALVDVLSDGRVELGLGAGYRVPEFEAFGADLSRRFPLLEERAREVRALWDAGRISPPPVQDRPGIWIGGHGPRVSRMAGRLGEGLLTLHASAYEHYRKALLEAGHDPARARVSGPINMVIADDPERAEATWAAIRPHFAYQWQSYQRYGDEGRPPQAGAASLQEIGDGRFDPDRFRSAGPDMNPPMIDVVTPDEAVRRLRSWLSPLPVEHGYFWLSIGAMPDEIAERHLALLATEVAPRVADVGGVGLAAPPVSEPTP